MLLGLFGIISYMRGCIFLAEAKGHSGGNISAALIISILLPGAILVMPVVLALALEDRNKPRSHDARPRRKRRGREFHSELERIIYYRRNALVGVYFGLAAIGAGVLLVIFRWGIFLDHGYEMLLGMVVFLFGYSAVIGGCWAWLKSKAQNEGLVFIALMPLTILFVPFVRLILFSAPELLAVGMIMMSLALVVVVLVLPDKSEASRRRAWWERH